MRDSTTRLRHAVLVVVFAMRDGRLAVLVDGERLPGGELEADETLEACARRHVDADTLAHLEQLETRTAAAGDAAEAERDARSEATVATVYLGLVAADVAAAGTWRDADDPGLTGEHDAIVRAARARLRAKLSYTNVGFALAPKTFTLSELREIYTAALGHDVSATNLQRVLVRRGVLEPTGAHRGPGRTGGRPAALFRFSSRKIEITDQFGFLRPPAV